MKKPSFPYLWFIITFISILVSANYFSFIHFNLFTPFLCFASRSYPLIRFLWIGFFCGLSIDCSTFSYPFGFYSFIFTASAFLCFQYKDLFFSDKVFSFGLFAASLSCMISLIELLFYMINHRNQTLSLYNLFSNVIVSSLIDGLVGIISQSINLHGKKWAKQLHLTWKEYKIRKKANESI